jgi:hypothetical protein
VNKKLIYAIVLLILLGCTPLLAPPEEKDALTARKKWPDITTEQLNNGYHIYINNCGKCHVLYKPERFSEKKWEEELPDMYEKSKLTPKEQELVTRFVFSRRESAITP